MEPITIHRSLFGLFRIFLAGLLASVVIFGLAHILVLQANTDPMVVYLLLFIGVVVVAVTLIAIVVYDSAKLVLSDEGVAVTNFATLFVSTSAVCKWDDIEDVAVTKTSPLAGLFGVGELTIETAGTKPRLSITWIPNADKWQAYIESKVPIEAGNV